MKKLMIILAGIFLIGLVGAQMSGPSVCCERTKDGAWCVNDIEDNCDFSINPFSITSNNPEGVPYKSSPTSCLETSYCRPGVCFDSVEGFCIENSPQVKCEQEENGTWTAGSAGESAQCQLGCCVIADQAAFVTLTRCKRLSNMFGVQTDYRTDIGSELECIATAQSQDMGACVFLENNARSCVFTTRGDCDGDFNDGLLCSEEGLGTICSRQFTTGCYRGDVYWFDSCGNRENVYFGGSQENKDISWNNGRIIDADFICEPHDGSNSECGNCDYLLGSRCAESGFFGGAPDGNYVCKKTTCKDGDGNERINGESWCADVGGASGDGLDPVGKRYFRQICIDGEVRTEACADFRNEVCLENSIPIDGREYGVAACRVNRWQDCTSFIGDNDNKDDCENTDQRDCIWIDTHYAQVIDDGYCVPNVPPGFDFWNSETKNEETCGQASVTCIVEYERRIGEDFKAEQNKECLEIEWARFMNSLCTSLGDCGGYVNYVGEYTDDGFSWKRERVDRGGLGSSYERRLESNALRSSTLTGQVIGVDVLKRIMG